MPASYTPSRPDTLPSPPNHGSCGGERQGHSPGHCAVTRRHEIGGFPMTHTQKPAGCPFLSLSVRMDNVIGVLVSHIIDLEG